MTPKTRRIAMVSIVAANGVLGALGASRAAGAGETASSYAPVVAKEDFQVDDVAYEGGQGPGHATAEEVARGAL